MADTDRLTRPRQEVRDLLCWLLLAATGLVAVLSSARFVTLGTHAPPFLGRYHLTPGPWLLVAVAVAVGVVVAARHSDQVGRRPAFGAVQVVSYLAALTWALTLAVGAGLSDRLDDTGAVAGHPLRYLRDFVARHAADAHGHPPGPALLLWSLHRLGAPVALSVTALGALSVPVALAAVRNICGELPARRYAPVLALAPYGAFLGGSMDGVVAAIGAGMLATGARASDRGRSGWPATRWAACCGLLVGVGAMFSYAVVWLGVSVVLLYFARRRPFLNVATGLGALAVPVAAAAIGFSWPAGLLAAHIDDTVRPAPELWWGPISLVALLLAAGPPLVASLRKLRNTPGWPCLVGAGLAVTFSVLLGFARGGAEAAWLPFFGWLTVAATAPERQAGPPVPAPLLLVSVGAASAIIIAAVLVPG